MPRPWSSGVLRRAKAGVRLLGAGEFTAKVAFSVWGASKSAVAAVEAGGRSRSGTVTTGGRSRRLTLPERAANPR